jgi:DNA-binding PadR family transcriptional regulator
MNIVKINSKKPSVFYTVFIEHKADGEISVFVKDLEETEANKKSVAYALTQSAKALFDESKKWVDLTYDQKMDLKENNDWYNFPSDLIEATEKKVKELNHDN